jgi:hypothetical protein
VWSPSSFHLLKPPTDLHDIWYEIHVVEGHSEALLYDFKMARSMTETKKMHWVIYSHFEKKCSRDLWRLEHRTISDVYKQGKSAKVWKCFLMSLQLGISLVCKWKHSASKCFAISITESQMWMSEKAMPHISPLPPHANNFWKEVTKLSVL